VADSDDWRVTVSVSGPGQPPFSLRQADVRRWKFLLVGAVNEDGARELAGQIRQEAPPGAAVLVEPAGVGWPFPPS
jgi:hypothetical protein